MVTIPHSVLCSVLKDLGAHITEEDVDQIVAACGWSDTIDYPYLELVQHLSIFNMAMVAARSALEIICRGSLGPTAPAALSSAVHSVTRSIALSVTLLTPLVLMLHHSLCHSHGPSMDHSHCASLICHRASLPHNCRSGQTICTV